MKQRSFFLRSIIVAALALMLACNSSSGTDGIFIPNLSNLWQSNRGTNFQFVPAKTDVQESTFTGDEDGDTFSGKFKSYDVEFTFGSGPDKNVKYSGKFVKDSNPVQMQVKGSNGVTLILTRS